MLLLLEFRKRDLDAHLDVVSSLFARTAHYPRVFLTPGDGQVVLSAEARDARYYAAVPAEVRGPTVAIAVDASALSLASGNAASSVEIEITEGRTVVRTDRGYEAPIAVYIGYSFGMPEVPSGAVAVEAKALASAIARVKRVAAPGGDRDYLDSVLLHTRNGHLRAVATDSYRLSWAEVPAVGELPATLVPKHLATAVVRALDAPGQAWVARVGDDFHICTADRHLLAPAWTGAYPDYERALRAYDSQPDVVAFGTKVRHLRELAEIAKKGAPGCEYGLGIVVDDGNVSAIRVPIQYDARKRGRRGSSQLRYAFAVDRRYLLDALATLRGEDVQVVQRGPGGPVIFRDPSDPHTFAVVMPLRS